MNLTGVAVEDYFVEGVELHEDLQPYVEEGGILGKMLRHPLVYSVPHNDIMNNIVNRRYELKRKHLKKMMGRKDARGYVFTFERAYRVQAFCDTIVAGIIKEGTVKARKLLKEVWVDTENPWENNYETWRMLLNGSFSGMVDKSLTSKWSQHSRVKLYRGISLKEGSVYNRHKPGLSWTTDESVALYFASRWGSESSKRGHYILTTELGIDRMCFYDDSRGEKEVVLNDVWLSDVEIKQVLPIDTKRGSDVI